MPRDLLFRMAFLYPLKDSGMKQLSDGGCAGHGTGSCC
jgi:hypothetical protein